MGFGRPQQLHQNLYMRSCYLNDHRHHPTNLLDTYMSYSEISMLKLYKIMRAKTPHPPTNECNFLISRWSWKIRLLTIYFSCCDLDDTRFWFYQNLYICFGNRQDPIPSFDTSIRQFLAYRVSQPSHPLPPPTYMSDPKLNIHLKNPVVFACISFQKQKF